jgi:uncharacterized protein with NAD-binding domain and iron-sulfur cluster
MSSPKKVAILGGGVGALATAWRLTSEPDWQDRYDITVYQMGWRLGGKGASGRRAPHWRIEEHGLHIWLGFYHNAFTALQQAHVELNPAVGPAPVGVTPPRMARGVFARCEDAFEPHSYVGVYQTFKGQPEPWLLDMPANDKKPWEADGGPEFWWYVQAMVKLLHEHGQALSSGAKPQAPKGEDGVLDWLADTAREWVDDLEDLTDDLALGALVLLQQAVDELADEAQWVNDALHTALKAALRRVQRWLVGRIEKTADDNLEDLRRLLLMDLFVAILRGLMEAGIHKGSQLGQLDDDFRLWLKANGALPLTYSLETNPLVRGVYDFVFAFENGDSSRPDDTGNFATAPALRTIFRMCFTYDGTIFWKMRAGMGDTIFTPLYKALEQRGVKFRFFHKVTGLRLSADRQRVAAIDMVRQVDTPAPYRPLVPVEGLDCWPSLPLYDQIAQGVQLAQAERDQGLNLESMWFQWADAAAFSLEAGRDFDEVVFGISLGSVPLLCAELCQHLPAWQRMADTVKTVCTMGVQHWLRPDLQGLGWTLPSPVMDAYHEPLDTWADMSHLLPREVWATGTAPRNVAYFCGALPEGPLNPADPHTPARGLATAQAASDDWLDHRLADLWPAVANGQGGIHRAEVVETYVRANVDPSERYVMSVAGSTSARLKANETGVSNLFIAGDWTDNGFNAGCVEAAFMSGIRAGNAMLGLPLNEGIKGRELCDD